MRLDNVRRLGAFACLCAAFSVWLTAPTQAKYTAVREAGTVEAKVTATSGAGTNWQYGYTGSVDGTNVIPASGYYTLHAYGAKGGDTVTITTSKGNEKRTGGMGGYSTGTVFLYKGTTLYVAVGGAGKNGPDAAGATLSGGYNGGGGVNGDPGVNHRYGSGGGATHFATAPGELSGLEGNKDAVLIVAGGGGGGRIQYNDLDPAARAGNGGAGGSCMDNGRVGEYHGNGGHETAGFAGGTQAFPPSQLNNSATDRPFGACEDCTSQGGGGGGYYAGYTGERKSETIYTGCGGGGTGYLTQGVQNIREAGIVPNGVYGMGGRIGGNDNASDGSAKVVWARKLY